MISTTTGRACGPTGRRDTWTFPPPPSTIILSAGGLRHHEIDRAAPACSLDTSGLSTARRFPVEAR